MTKATATLDAGTDAAIAAAVPVVDDAGKVRTRIQLLPFGDPFHGRDGRGPYRLTDAAHAAAVIATTASVQRDTDLFIDYDHQSVLSAPKGGTAKAAGWIKRLSVEPDGIYGEVQWTKPALAALEAGEYRYISPFFRHRPDGSITRLVNAGLTNSPNLDLAAIAAADMSVETGDPQPMKTVAEALGLSADASEEEVLAAIKDMMEKSTAQANTLTALDKTLPEARKALSLDAGADVSAIATAITEAMAAIDPTQFVPRASYDALARTMREDAEKSAIATVDQAIADGKVPPAQKAWAMSTIKKDPASFHSFLAGAAPFQADDIVTDKPGGKDAPKLSADEAAIASQLGLSDDQFLKSREEGNV